MPEILLAEDNAADVYLIREALREHSVEYTMRVVPDGKEVLRILSPEHLDTQARELRLIILDLNLPRHDGIEILQYLRALPQMSGIPVVVLTSSDSPKDRLLANQLGAACYFRKPSSLEQFLSLGAVLKDLLTRKENSDGLAAAEGAGE